MSVPIDPLLDPDRRRTSGMSSDISDGGLPPPRYGAPNATPPVPQSRLVSRRRKPARGSKVASLALSVSTTLGLATLFAQDDVGATADPLLDTTAPIDSGAGATVTASEPTLTTASTVPSTTVSTTGVSSSAVASVTESTIVAGSTATIPEGSVLNGTYLGAASTNRWGTVQVRAVYSDGSLVDVQIVSYPDGDRKSIAINQRSLPSMINDAISIQSADVSNVSGATYTWRSYTASLQSAMSAARAASGLS